MNYVFQLNDDNNEINYIYEPYTNEIKSIKDISNNLYNNLIEKNKTDKKCKLLCNNFIQSKTCRWHDNNKCKFAHSYEELDTDSKKKVLELGLQSYYYFLNLNRDLNKNISVFDLSNIFKNAEIIYKKEALELNKMQTQYIDLHHYLLKIKNQMNTQHNISSINIGTHFDNLKLNTNLKLDKTIMELKELLNTTIGCKICYKNIIELNDNDLDMKGNHNSLDAIAQDTFNSFNLINLSCGHSICEYCHIELINKKSSIYIECPICRKFNNIKDTAPNYELNEQLFTIKLIISKLGFANKMIKTEHNLLKFINKDFYNKFNKLRNPTYINGFFPNMKLKQNNATHTIIHDPIQNKKNYIRNNIKEAPW